jgi:hypothetical protein
MTYEPGQQVLVRGEILEPPMPAHIGLFVRFVSEDGAGRRVYIRAADVVGPAPATPDKGERLGELRGKALRNALDALAAAEARIEAVIELHNPVYFFDRGEACETCDEDWPCATILATRRALSVEAAGPEGGGGHE